MQSASGHSTERPTATEKSVERQNTGWVVMAFIAIVTHVLQHARRFRHLRAHLCVSEKKMFCDHGIFETLNACDVLQHCSSRPFC